MVEPFGEDGCHMSGVRRCEGAVGVEWNVGHFDAAQRGLRPAQVWHIGAPASYSDQEDAQVAWRRPVVEHQSAIPQLAAIDQVGLRGESIDVIAEERRDAPGEPAEDPGRRQTARRCVVVCELETQLAHAGCGAYPKRGLPLPGWVERIDQGEEFDVLTLLAKQTSHFKSEHAAEADASQTVGTGRL